MSQKVSYNKYTPNLLASSVNGLDEPKSFAVIVNPQRQDGTIHLKIPLVSEIYSAVHCLRNRKNVPWKFAGNYLKKELQCSITLVYINSLYCNCEFLLSFI